MHVAFGRVRRKSRIFADYTDCADYRRGNGGRRSGIGLNCDLCDLVICLDCGNCLNQDLWDWESGLETSPAGVGVGSGNSDVLRF